MLNDQTTASATPTAPPLPDEAGATSEVTGATATQDAASAEQLEHLLVLSQAPLTLDAALEHEQEQEADADDRAAPLTVGRLIAQYLRLLGQVLGVGLVTAAVRHYGANPALYLGLGFGGALLFAAASTPRAAAGSGLLGRIRDTATSLVLGLGLGLLVGGILHFSAFPHTAAVLVPLGIALSIAALVARDGRALIGRDLISAGVMIAGLLVWASVGLGMGAKKLDPPAAKAGATAPAAGDHGATPAAGDHGATPAAADHGAADAKSDHGEGAAKADHAATPAAGHGDAAAKTDHAATPAAGHGDAAAKTDHAATPAAGHGDAAAKTDHAATPAADHGTTAKPATAAHGATKSAEAAKEDEVTAADVLVPRKAH